MKRSREEEEEGAELLLSLACGSRPAEIHSKAKPGDGVFECKTCSRRFPTFQALGGHRTSHLRPRVDRSAARPINVHRCSVCGVEFPLGQALGGHMRRHKAMADDSKHSDMEELKLNTASLEFDNLFGFRRTSSHHQLLQLFV